jgi:hypothetical protein
MEEMLMKQNDIQKKEIKDLRKMIKNLQSGIEKDHIKGSVVQWLVLLAGQ